MSDSSNLKARFPSGTVIFVVLVGAALSAFFIALRAREMPAEVQATDAYIGASRVIGQQDPGSEGLRSRSVSPRILADANDEPNRPADGARQVTLDSNDAPSADPETVDVPARYERRAVELPEVRLTRPSAKDRQVTLVVAQLLRREHLLNDPLDDTHSRRGLQNFLESLDRMKVYFYQNDIDEFLRHQDELDDQIKRGDIRFAYSVFHRFLECVRERLDLVNVLLEQDFDFTLDDEFITDRDDANYPADRQQAEMRWRRRIKFDLLNLKADKTEGLQARERLWRRYSSIAKRWYQTDSDEILEMYLTAMTTGFDPHTTYMSASTLDNFKIVMRLHLEGIGAALKVEDGYTVVSKVIPGGAADKHKKLKPEDRIVSVGQGDEGEMTDVIDMKLSDVVKLIRGKSGTVVRLGVNPGGVGETHVYKITRAKIELKDSEARSVIFEKDKKPDGSPYRFGVIELPSFYMDMGRSKTNRQDFKSTTRDVRKILDQFSKQNLDALIVDLRRNGGGSLQEAINLTGLFIDRGPVVQVKDSIGNVEHLDDENPGMAWVGPLVVLTSKFSASASEIFAGAVQDYGRGLVIGDTSTHGKGTVQSLLDLGSQLFRNLDPPPKFGALKITMQQFYRPAGESTQKIGVESDLVLPSITNHLDVAESDLDFALANDRVKSVPFQRYNMISAAIVNDLTQRSITRREKSEDFKKLHEKIARYLEQKQRSSMSLNEERFFARLEEFDAEKEEEKHLDEDDNPDRPVVDRNYYFEEVLDITIDYSRWLEAKSVAILNQ